MESEFTTMQCPNCGGKLIIGANITTLKCENCGTEHMVKRGVDGIILESYARCPTCNRNDKAEKVSSLMRSQTQRTNTVTYQTRVIYVKFGNRSIPVEKKYAVPTQSVQMSDLAKMLIPPIKPIVKEAKSNNNKVSGIGLISVGVVLTLASFCGGILVIIDSNQSGSVISSILGMLCAVVISFGLIGLGYVLIWKNAPKEKLRNEQINILNQEILINWENAMKRYQKLYYCQRDDCVFIQGENISAPVNRMMELLYR